MKYTIYNAGPLFAEYESKQRKEEGFKFRTELDKLGVEYEIGNPADFDINPLEEGAAQPEPATIYETDAKFIDIANTFFFDLVNEDPGTMVELGMFYEKLRQGKDVKGYIIISDFRSLSNSRNGYHSTIGFNSFVIGGADKHEIKIFSNFDAALKQFIEDIK